MGCCASILCCRNFSSSSTARRRSYSDPMESKVARSRSSRDHQADGAKSASLVAPVAASNWRDALPQTLWTFLRQDCRLPLEALRTLPVEKLPERDRRL